MAESDRQKRDLPSASARVTLPANLPEALKHLDDGQLRELADAAAAETTRRRQSLSKTPVDATSAPSPPSRRQTAGQQTKGDEVDEIPQGKANLIRASFKAGVKPAAIARTFGVPQAAVSRVLGLREKSKR